MPHNVGVFAMNIHQANSIDLSAILKKIGCLPVRQTGAELWYFSPFRKEKTPSFHAHTTRNVWYDFGEAKGGAVIDFVSLYLQSHGEDHTLVDALRWLRNMDFLSKPRECVSKEHSVEYGTTLELRKVAVLQNQSLIHYLHSRGVPLSSAKKYLKEIHVRNLNTGKSFFALGLPNENGGYELRNKFFKGCLAPKSISFIRGAKLLPEELHVFEGGIDFLSALAYQKKNRFEGDVIILNSVACLSEALPYIKNYSYKILYGWLDNDAAGRKASKILHEYTLSQQKLVFKPMNKIYAKHKDVNAWHMHKLELKS